MIPCTFGQQQRMESLVIHVNIEEGNLCLAIYLFVASMLLKNRSYFVEKTVSFPLNGTTFEGKHVFGLTSVYKLWVPPMKNLPNLLCLYQTGYSAIESGLELLVPATTSVWD